MPTDVHRCHSNRIWILYKVLCYLLTKQSRATGPVRYWRPGLPAPFCVRGGLITRVRGNLSKDALCHHSVSHLHEAGHVGTANEVDMSAFLTAIAYALVVYGSHDVVQAFVNLLSGP